MIEKTYEEKFPGILKEEGFASSIEEPMESTKYLALHKSAKVGTILFVRNQMNDLKVMVRVIGKLPDTGSNQKKGGTFAFFFGKNRQGVATNMACRVSENRPPES